jgi:hypothetical protein
MNTNNKAMIKAALMFGGGFLLFIIVKNYKHKKSTPKSFDAATEKKNQNLTHLQSKNYKTLK